MLHLRILQQVGFNPLHITLHLPDAVSIGEKGIRPEVGLVHRREKILGQQPHGNQRKHEGTHHHAKRDHPSLDQESKNSFKLLV